MSTPTPVPAVSVVLPVRNGASTIGEVVAAVLRHAGGAVLDVVVVDDGSTDDSVSILDPLERAGHVRVIAGERRGAAAAINIGVRAARHPIIVQLDQDVIVHAGWLPTLLRALDDPRAGAAQGRYVYDPSASIWARIMALDLEQRYASLPPVTSHICTGNSAYRRAALDDVGLFDERLGYGYDNDMSYRLSAAGHVLRFCHDAHSTHRWREGLIGYCRQQYGFGYGRLDVLVRHPGRIAGDSVSPLSMMLHPVMLAGAYLSIAASLVLVATGRSWWPALTLSAILIAILVGERLLAGARIAWRVRDAAGLCFPVAHLVRDHAWVWAIVVWLARRLAATPAAAAHSMGPSVRAGATGRPLLTGTNTLSSVPEPPARMLALIPAHNEAVNLAAVIEDLRTHQPDLDVLVVDDGSTDGTVALLETLRVRWLRLPERLGIGSAMRAGLCYASRLGYDTVVRVDGDGQHRASDIAGVMAPLRSQQADVVIGSRYVGQAPLRGARGSSRFAVRLLAAWLSWLTGRPVTDPTSGFTAFGPRAVRLLAEYHPTGYPEPELHLIVTRHRLAIVEVPIRIRPRVAGRTSLTPGRLLTAGARVVLALILEPIRQR